MVEPSTRTVHIKSMQGEVRTVSLPADSLISALKAKVAEVFPVPVERQRLIFQGKLLKDDTRLSDFVKEDGLTVHMMMRALEERPAEAPPQPQPQQSFFSPFSLFGDAQGFDPQGLIRQVGEMVGQVIPPDMQGVQVNFSGSGPLFQVIQRSQAQNPPGAAPVPPAPIPPDPPSRPLAEERKSSQEFAFPFPYLHTIGQIINTLTGPQSSFPPPSMPQLPFNRNPLVLLGGYLYMYQFQLLRLLPFLARCAELMQRESLVNEPQQRVELQTLARAMGSAMNELVMATRDVAPLLQTLEVGQQPGQFRLHLPQGNVSHQDAVVRPAAPSADSAPSAAQRVPDASAIAHTHSLFTLLNATGVDLHPAGALINGLLDGVTLHDLGLLAEGRAEPIAKFYVTLGQHLRAAMGGADTPEGRALILREFLDTVSTNLFMSEFFGNRMRPGFDYLGTTLSAAERTGERLISLVLDHPESGFVPAFRQLFLQNVGLWAETVIENVERGAQTLDQLLEAQFSALLSTSPRESVRGLFSVVYPLSLELVKSAVQHRSSPQGLMQAMAPEIERDMKAQEQETQQRGLSRAYQALSSFPSAATGSMRPQELMNLVLTQSLADHGIELHSARLPEDLADAFVSQLEADITARSREDKDFDQNRFKNIAAVASRRS